MNEELQDKLVQDLRTSGFYSEMMAIRACTAGGWSCHGSFTYFDKDERTTRECDFEAVREWRELREDGINVKVVARVLGQVKKSEKPWIVFADRSHQSFEDGLENLLHITTAEKPWKYGGVLREHSPALANGWIGSGIHEAFKKPTDASRWTEHSCLYVRHVNPPTKRRLRPEWTSWRNSSNHSWCSMVCSSPRSLRPTANRY